jgi:hypothetical protein
MVAAPVLLALAALPDALGELEAVDSAVLDGWPA